MTLATATRLALGATVLQLGAFALVLIPTLMSKQLVVDYYRVTAYGGERYDDWRFWVLVAALGCQYASLYAFFSTLASKQVAPKDHHG